jgi:CDP-glucose 4,6-dehydratase
MESVSGMSALARGASVSWSWAGRRALVTGATGMIGSWLVKELLARGVDVAVLVRDGDPQSELHRSGDGSRVTLVSGQLEDFGSIERAINEHEADTVFHLAAQTLVGTAYRYPLATFEANVRGTYHVLEACRLHASLVQRVVIASSDKAYGAQPSLPYTEDMPLMGRAPYEVSKSCADLLAQCYHQTYGLPVAIARCGNVYGGGDLNWSRVVPGTVRACLRQQRPIIRSDGTFLRDYIYVRDVVHAYLCLAESLTNPALRGEAFNFGTDSPRSVLDVVRTIQSLMEAGDLEPDIRETATQEIHSQWLSSEKASRLLGWRPRFSFEDGLRETIAWYDAWLGAHDGDRESCTPARSAAPLISS